MTTRQRKNSRPAWVAPLVALIVGIVVIWSEWLFVGSARDIGLARAAALTPTTIEATTVVPTPSGEVCYTECELRDLIRRLEEENSCDLVSLEYILETYFGGSARDLLEAVGGEYGFEVRLRLEACGLDARVRRDGPVVTTTTAPAPPGTIVVVVTVPSPTTTQAVTTTTQASTTTTTQATTTTTAGSTTTITSPPPCTGNPDENCEKEP